MFGECGVQTVSADMISGTPAARLSGELEDRVCKESELLLDGGQAQA